MENPLAQSLERRRELHYPKQEVTCDKCKGHKRVAIITRGPLLFDEHINKPLPYTYIDARQRLQNYRGNDAGTFTMLVRDLANNLDTTPCPWCRATGISCSIQQLTKEEAAEIRAREEVQI